VISLQIAADSLRGLIAVDVPYCIPTASDEIKSACYGLCNELHTLSEGHRFYESTWIDSFLGFDFAYVDGRVATIDGNVVYGDEQRDAQFLVRLIDGSYQIDYGSACDQGRPYVFRFLDPEESNRRIQSDMDMIAGSVFSRGD